MIVAFVNINAFYQEQPSNQINLSMKNLIVLFIALCLMSCAKEDVFGPLKLKNGQEVELLVDHKYGSTDEKLLKLPNKEAAGASLVGFIEREPGYTYRVKARFHNEENPPQDGPSYWFDFLNVISKEQYKGNDAFEIQLIKSYIPGGPFIQMGKQANDYYYVPEKIQLTYANEVVGKQLEEIWQDAREMRENGKPGQLPKWKFIRATVVHDQQKFGKAYLVQAIQFVL
jgi:hypothetical protein